MTGHKMQLFERFYVDKLKVSFSDIIDHWLEM